MKKSKIIISSLTTTILVGGGIVAAAAQACATSAPTLDQIRTIIVNSVNELSNYNSVSPPQLSVLSTQILTAINTDLTVDNNFFTVQTLVFNNVTESSLVANTDNSEFTLVINNVTGTALSQENSISDNFAGNAMLVINNDNGNLTVASNGVSGVGVATQIIRTLFTNLDGFVVGSRQLSINEQTIIDAMFVNINALNLGVVRPNNLINSSFGSLVEGETVNFGFNTSEIQIVNNQNNNFTVSIPQLGIFVESSVSQNNPEFQGLNGEFTGLNLEMNFNLIGDTIENVILNGNVSRVAPSFTLTDQEITDGINNALSDIVNATIDTIFSSFVNNNAVANSDLSVYSFINFISLMAGLDTIFEEGKMETMLDFTLDSTTINTGMVTIAISSNFNLDNFSNGAIDGAWGLQASDNPAASNTAPIPGYISEISINVNIYGTQNNPIFIFTPGQNFSYGQTQVETLFPALSISGISDGSGFYQTAIYNEFVVAISNDLNLTPPAIVNFLETNETNFTSLVFNADDNFYTATVSIAGGNTSVSSNQITGIMVIIANFNPQTQRVTIASDGVTGLIQN